MVRKITLLRGARSTLFYDLHDSGMLDELCWTNRLAHGMGGESAMAKTQERERVGLKVSLGLNK